MSVDCTSCESGDDVLLAVITTNFLPLIKLHARLEPEALCEERFKVIKITIEATTANSDTAEEIGCWQFIRFKVDNFQILVDILSCYPSSYSSEPSFRIQFDTPSEHPVPVLPKLDIGASLESMLSVRGRLPLYRRSQTNSGLAGRLRITKVISFIAEEMALRALEILERQSSSEEEMSQPDHHVMRKRVPTFLCQLLLYLACFYAEEENPEISQRKIEAFGTVIEEEIVTISYNSPCPKGEHCDCTDLCLRDLCDAPHYGGTLYGQGLEFLETAVRNWH